MAGNTVTAVSVADYVVIAIGFFVFLFQLLDLNHLICLLWNVWHPGDNIIVGKSTSTHSLSQLDDDVRSA